MSAGMKRRDFITLLGGVAAWPLAARAQQPAMTHVGIVTIQPRTASMYAAFDQRLCELGYVEGQNRALHYVNPEHQAGGTASAIEELRRWKVDIILVTYQSTLKAALGAGVTVPIVMVAVDYDPLALGYVKRWNDVLRGTMDEVSLHVRLGRPVILRQGRGKDCST